MKIRFIILLAASIFLHGTTSYAGGADYNSTQATHVLITGRRIPSTKDSIDRYSAQNIDNLAAMTIGEVIARLERRNGGRPFSIIVNGRRLADISDLREIPPEALSQIEILPNTSTGRYGFGPEHKVLNLVLKKKILLALDQYRVSPTYGRRWRQRECGPQICQHQKRKAL